MKRLVYLGLIGLFMVGCRSTSTEIVSSWNKPNNAYKLSSAQKILVLAMTQDDSQRRIIEDAFVQQLGVKAQPSYAYLRGNIKQIDQSAALNQIKKDGFDVAMVLRLTSQYQTGSKRSGSVNLTPSLYYGFGRNFSAGIGLSINPGYDTRQTSYEIESSVYQFPADDLIWNGVIQAKNPNDINSLANTMAREVVDKMRTDGLVN